VTAILYKDEPPLIVWKVKTMASSVISNFSANNACWPSLRQAIAASSGYQTWLADCQFDASPSEDLVLVYLRQTLATLAY
jgi:hypothetical protein